MSQISQEWRKQIFVHVPIENPNFLPLYEVFQFLFLPVYNYG